MHPVLCFQVKPSSKHCDTLSYTQTAFGQSYQLYSPLQSWGAECHEARSLSPSSWFWQTAGI